VCVCVCSIDIVEGLTSNIVCAASARTGALMKSFPVIYYSPYPSVGHAHTHTHTPTHARTFTCTHARAHTLAHTHTHTSTTPSTHAHVYTHTNHHHIIIIIIIVVLLLLLAQVRTCELSRDSGIISGVYNKLKASGRQTPTTTCCD